MVEESSTTRTLVGRRMRIAPFTRRFASSISVGLAASASVSNGTPEGGGASSTVKGGFGAARAVAATRDLIRPERVIEEDEIDSA
jgi:hypothetical protein